MDRQSPRGVEAERRVASPLRTCIVARASRPPEELVRFVVGPDGGIVPDVARRLPGRGVWVTADHATVAAAVRTKAFARALKRAVEVPADLADRVEALLVRRALEAFALARKAGLVVTGFVKVEAALGRGEVNALVHASDAADDGAMRLDRKFIAVSGGQGARGTAIVRAFTADQLSLAIGGANVVHAALKSGGAAARFLAEAERIAIYRAGLPAPAQAAAAEHAREAFGETGSV